MTISSTTRKAGPFNGNDSATSFPFTFKVFAKTDIQVTKTVVATGAQSVLVLDSDYSVTLNSNQDTSPGGTITYPISGSPLPTGQKLDVVDATPATQGNDISNAGSFLPQVIEDAFDRLTILIQQVLEKVSRAVKAPVGESMDMTLPASSVRALKVFTWDASGKPSATTNNLDDLNAQAGASAASAASSAVAAAASAVLSALHEAGAAAVAVGNFLQLSVGAVARSFLDKARDLVHILDNGADPTGVASANTALANLDATGRQVEVSRGTYRVSANLTLSSDWIVKKGGGFTIDAGVTLTINGAFTAGMSQVFYGSGSVKFGAGSIDFIRPEWFGCVMAGPSGPFVDNSANFLKAIQCATNSTSSFTYKIKLSQGVLALGSATGTYCVVVPTTGTFILEGEGRGASQIRAISVGGVWPRGIFQFNGSTSDNRIKGIYFYGGSSTSPTKYGIDSSAMTHMDVSECAFANFSIAGYVIAQWSNSIKDCDLSFCGVGVWVKNSSAANDNTIDTCRFVSCVVPVVINQGVNTRILNCQFQAPNAAPFSKCHIYINGNGVTVDCCYFESQAFGGMAGMTFTNPETVTIWADIICNASPYYSDEEGTVTTTLAQLAPGGGTMLHVKGTNSFNTAPYYIAGAGGSGYTAGTANIVALNGQGVGGTCTIGVTGSSVNATSGFVGGSGYLPGDRVSLVKDGTGAVGIITTTGVNNSPTGIRIGGEAAIYPGNMRTLQMDNNNHGSGSYLSVYKDPTYCKFQRVTLINPSRAGGVVNYSVIGSYSAVLRSNFADIDNNLEAFNSGVTRRNYFGSTLSLPDPLLKSTFARNAGRNSGLPYYRLTLNPAETASDVMSGSITVGTSGVNNPELCGRRLYFAVDQTPSGPNIKLRLTLSAVNGTSTVTIGNYDSSTVFTSAAATSREEVSIVVPSLGGTINWSVQVIAAAAAAGQFVDIMAPVITMVGFPYDDFPVAEFNGPLIGTATLDPAALTDTNGLNLTMTVYGARVGDAVYVAAPYTMQGMIKTAEVSATNTVTIRLQDEAAASIDLISGTWTAYVTPGP